MIRDAILGASMVVISLAATVCPAQAPPPTTAIASEKHTLSASTKRLEVVLKNDPLLPSRPGALVIYLSDFATNAPVRDASVQLRLRTRSGDMWSGVASATETEGVYAAVFTPPDTGTVTVIATIGMEGQEHQVALAGLEIVTPEPTVAREGMVGAGWRWQWWYGPVAVVLLATVVSLGSRHRRRRGLAMGAFVLLGLWRFGADAHEGHNQPPTASGAVVGPGSVVYLAKESQFLLGVRTQLVTREIVKQSHRVLGRVVPRSGGELEITAPQAGRIYFPGGRTPVLGARVASGEAVATLVVIDSLELRAALGGVVTEVSVVNGQLVDAGQKLLRVLDPSVVWVHADIYEKDLERV